MRALLILVICALALPVMAQTPEYHNPKPFGMWVEEVKQEALANGISKALVDRAFVGVTPNPSLIALDRKQPEGTKTFSDYLAGAVTQSRINQGRKLYAQHKALLESTAQKYGVQARFLVALWGIETSFGGYTGNQSTIEALATLAYDGRRSEFFRNELIAALQIIDQGHTTLEAMNGSWAGALGQCQFMPTSFHKYAVDGNGDGKIDIWHSLPDVFASMANYLKSEGWDANQTWGRKVRLPQNFDMTLTDGKHYKTLAEWTALGVVDEQGSALPDKPLQAAITIPGKPYEGVYIVYGNYDVLLHWNKSRYFATAVGTLSDAFLGL